jgi:hypothetical protein
VDDLSLVEEILEWLPERRLVRRVRLPSGAQLTARYELEPDDTWTGVWVRWYGSAAASDQVERERSRLDRLAASLGPRNASAGGMESDGAHR